MNAENPMKYALISLFALAFVAGCQASGNRNIYSRCDATDVCAYPADYCVDTGGAGQCSLTCFDDFDCPSRNGYAGSCRVLAAYPDNSPICFQGCNFDTDCPSGTACSSGVCVAIVEGPAPTLPNYEVCGDPSECDPTFSETCYQIDAAGRGMCSSVCERDSDCLGRGAIRGACRSLAAFPSNSAVCFLACDETTLCPEFTACNGDVCVPNY